MGRRNDSQIKGEALLRDQGCADATVGEQEFLFGNGAGIACSVNTKPEHYDIEGRGSKAGRGPVVDFRLPDGRFMEAKFGKSDASRIAWTTGTSDHLNSVIFGLATTSEVVLTVMFTEVGEGLYKREVYDAREVAKIAISGLVGMEVPVGDFDPSMTADHIKATCPAGSVPWSGFTKGTAPIQNIGLKAQGSGREQAVDADGNPMTVTAPGPKVYVKGVGRVRLPVQKPVWARNEDGSIKKSPRVYGMWTHNVSMLRSMGLVTEAYVREDDLLAGI